MPVSLTPRERTHQRAVGVGRGRPTQGDQGQAVAVDDVVGDPDVVAEGSGMRVFFGGYRSGNRDDPVQNLVTLSELQELKADMLTDGEELFVLPAVSGG